ncbi:MAG TPA: hypothetical protein VGB68_17450 [Pyrinomonadaceae bacterium]
MPLNVIILFALISVFGAACANNFARKPEVEQSLYSVSGESCAISEDDIFTLPDRKVFGECEIRKNPERFNGKLLRIKARYNFMMHGALLESSAECGLSRSIDEAISIGFRSEKDYEIIRNLQALPVDIIAVGEFSASAPSRESDSIRDRTPYRFTGFCLEEAKAADKKNNGSEPR